MVLWGNKPHFMHMKTNIFVQKQTNGKICGKYLCLTACNRKLCGLIMNVVSTLLPPGTFCQTVPLAGEEAARVVSTQEHVVAVPLPSRVQVLFTTACLTSSVPMRRTFTLRILSQFGNQFVTQMFITYFT